MFKKFTSIENSYNQEFISKIKADISAGEEFVVQEKAHGSNLSIWSDDGINFKMAKRSGFLLEDEQFYNHQMLLKKLTPNLIKLWADLSVNITLESMALYGEVIGGVYPHDDVTKNKAAIMVQKGVFYTPNNEFYAFDLLVNRSYFLNIEALNKLLESTGFLYAKTLLKGNLEAALQYSNIFQTKIAEQLGFPDIENNTCEGIIIKTINDVRRNNGQRVILKNKNEKWSEKEKVGRRVKVVVEISEPVKALQNEIALYVTENRLNNVISKIGEVSPKDFGSLMALLSKDVLEDFLKDNAKAMNDLDKKESKQVNKSINKKVLELVKNRLNKG